MPLKELGKKKEKRDFKQEFLETIAKNYGLQNAIIMEDALGEQKKQLQVAMHTGGMAFEDIAQSKGIDLLGELMKNQGSVKAVGETQSQPEQQDFKRGGNWLSRPMQVNTQTGQMLPAELLGGLLQSHPDDLLKMAQAQSLMQKSQGGETKGVYGFDPSTGAVVHRGEIPSKAELRVEQPKTGMEKVPPEIRPILRASARKLYGVRGAKEGLPDIVDAYLSGMSPDQIDDSIRMSAQSPEFSGAVRDAIQMVSIDDSETIRNVNFDAADDFIQKGDMGGVKDYLKAKARKSAGMEYGNKVAGKERTIELLNEIKGDLEFLEKNGQSTGFIAGNIENISARIGKTVKPGLRKVASKIATSLIEYRRWATGVNFSVPESREYRTIFPGIDKFGDFNLATTEGLVEVFNGDLKRFYSQKFGNNNFSQIFGDEYSNIPKTTQEPEQGAGGWTPEKESRYQELLKKRGK